MDISPARLAMDILGVLNVWMTRLFGNYRERAVGKPFSRAIEGGFTKIMSEENMQICSTIHWRPGGNHVRGLEKKSMRC